MNIEEYLKHLTEKDYAESTIESYGRLLGYLTDWLVERDLTLEKLSVNEYRKFRQSRSWGNSAERLCLVVSKSYLRWKGYSNKDDDKPNHPLLGYTISKKKGPTPRAYRHEELVEILNAIDRDTKRGKRDYPLLLLLYDTGLRASELCRLKVSEVDFERRRLSVETKGGDIETKIIGHAVMDAIKDWLTMRAQFCKNGTGTLFVSIGGRTPHKPITPRGLRDIILKIGKAAGLTLSPHDLRRSFAVNNVRKGVPHTVVMKQGGWHDLDSFMVYLETLTVDDYEGFSLGDDLLDVGDLFDGGER